MGRVASTADVEARPGVLRTDGRRADRARRLRAVARRRGRRAGAARARREGRRRPRPRLALARAHAAARREGARGRGDGVQPEPGRRARGEAGARAVERGARQARRDPPGLLPVRGRLGVGAAVGADAREHGPAAGRVHARGRAVPGLGRHPRAVARAGVAPARGRVDDAGRLHQHAGLGGEPAERVRAPAGRTAGAPAAPGRAARLPRAGRGRAQDGRRGRRGADLLQPLERAQPPGVHQPAASGVRSRRRRAARPRPTRRSRRRSSRRSTPRPASSSSSWARRRG